jgi:hypothetical protein
MAASLQDFVKGKRSSVKATTEAGSQMARRRSGDHGSCKEGHSFVKKKKRMSDGKILEISQVLTLNRVARTLLASKVVSEDDIMDLCEQAMEPDGFSRFMVRDKSTGLFSTGSRSPRMVPIGKVWNSLAAVRFSI